MTTEELTFAHGDLVRVRTDATAWGDSDAFDSVHRGEAGIVYLAPIDKYERNRGLQGYDCWLEITKGRHAGSRPRFFFHELEARR